MRIKWGRQLRVSLDIATACLRQPRSLTFQSLWSRQYLSWEVSDDCHKNLRCTRINSLKKKSCLKKRILFRKIGLMQNWTNNWIPKIHPVKYMEKNEKPRRKKLIFYKTLIFFIVHPGVLWIRCKGKVKLFSKSYSIITWFNLRLSSDLSIPA